MGGYISSSSNSGLTGPNGPDPYEKWKPTRPENGDVVLIPVDDSSHSERAFYWYVEHMHKPSNIVRLMYCADLHFTSNKDLRSRTFEDELDTKMRTSEHLVDKYYKKLAEAGVDGSVQSFVGVPGEVIVDHAMRTNSTCIILGSRGLGLIRRTILGSVSEYVVNHSKVPVTVIPPE